jgi:NAD(P)-dependent dehydrogenase (short-subunit alcohol dehydrogenase family)
MDNALIIGDSGGIGGAIADALRARGTPVTGLSRTRDGLDVTDEASIEAALAPLEGPFDLIFVATGKLDGAGHRPEKAIAEVSADALVDQFRVNAAGPMLVLKHALPLLASDRPAVFAALSARVGSIGDNGIGGWHSYRTAKAALNMLIHGAALELKRTHKQACAVCLHPGTVYTDFTAPYAKRHATVEPEEAAGRLLAVIDGLTPEETGRFFDYAGAEIPW